MELANVWPEYDRDRKLLMSRYNQEKGERARLIKEAIEERERQVKIQRAKRWETFKEEQRVRKEEREKLMVKQNFKKTWVLQIIKFS